MSGFCIYNLLFIHFILLEIFSIYCIADTTVFIKSGTLRPTQYTVEFDNSHVYGGVDVCYLRVSLTIEIPLANFGEDDCIPNLYVTFSLSNSTIEELSEFPKFLIGQGPVTIVGIIYVDGIALPPEIPGANSKDLIRMQWDHVIAEYEKMKSVKRKGPILATSTGLRTTGSLKWLVVGSTLTDDRSIYNSFPNESYFERIMFNPYNGVGVSYAAASYGTLSITPANTDYVIVNIPKSTQNYRDSTPCNTGSFYNLDIKPLLPVNPNNYDMITIIWPNTAVCSVIGQAQVLDTLTFISQNRWTSVIIHELGHNMGLRHSGIDTGNVGYNYEPTVVCELCYVFSVFLFNTVYRELGDWIRRLFVRNGFLWRDHSHHSKCIQKIFNRMVAVIGCVQFSVCGRHLCADDSN